VTSPFSDTKPTSTSPWATPISPWPSLMFVEFLNIRLYRRRRQEQPVDLHQRYSEQESPSESAGRERRAREPLERLSKLLIW
jgi:hypothetical protein